MPRYTQGLMDLGATICTSRAARLPAVPGAGAVPGPGRRRRRSATRSRPASSSAARSRCALLWAERADGAVWLERRPATGIWGGLYCLPVFDSEDELLAALPRDAAGPAAGGPALCACADAQGPAPVADAAGAAGATGQTHASAGRRRLVCARRLGGAGPAGAGPQAAAPQLISRTEQTASALSSGRSSYQTGASGPAAARLTARRRAPGGA